MRSRAAILPFAGDPFLLHYWLELFYKIWSDEIDRLYIVCDTSIEKPVLEYIEFLCTQDPGKLTYLYSKDKGQHGDKILRGLLAATEKHIMLIEDDAYIFKPGAVDWCFKQLESGDFDIVGSKRSSCHEEIVRRANQIWGTTINGAGDQGCNFWPCYFFSTRDLLLATDRNYNSRAWVQGEIIAPLQDYVVVVPTVAADTFVNTSLQLRAMVPERRILYVPQYHAHPDDKIHFERKSPYTPFDGTASWTHIGSLSSGVDGILKDDQNRTLARRTIDPPNPPTTYPDYCNTEMEIKEFERRVQWFDSYWQHRDPDEIQDFAEAYRKAIDAVIVHYRLKPGRIKERQEIYKQAFNL